MTNRELAVRAAPRALTGGSAILGCAALAAIVGWWAWRAFHDPNTLDTGLAYQAGRVAWRTGHPEHLLSWDGTPFLAGVFALISRGMGIRAAADLVTALNVGIVVGLVAVTMRRLRDLLRPTWWWITAFALISFGPMMSSVWWKQFNIIALALALISFEQLRRGRPQRAGAALGLSVAIKPMVFLLPFVLLARRGTRRVGALALAWIAGLNLAGQGLLAARAGSISALNPWIPLQNFLHKSQPANIWACHPENFAPGSVLCRLAGSNHWTLQHLVVWAGVALLGLWVIDSLRGYAAHSWELFAFVCPLSVMLSPLAWSHYQIMLAPLFVLLVIRFLQNGARIGEWAGLAVAFALASLIWRPHGTLISGLTGLLKSQNDLFAIASVAQFAQYALVLTGVLWYTRAGRSGHRA